MATENRLQTITLVAAADLSAEQFTHIEAGAVQAGAGEKAVGILQNKPTSGQSATIAIAGSISKVVAGAAVSAGAQVASDATGRAVTATTSDVVTGTALTAAGAADEIFEVLLAEGTTVSA
jgi:hypothetical protein